MENIKQSNSMLRPYRILDLTEDGYMIGGRILADLGAGVIKIEPPGGSRSRIAPFYKDIPDPEKSLYWFAYNLNKRGITLNIDKPEGRALFKQLVQKADAIIESFDVGYLSSIGLGYADLIKIKPNIILTSITPFGQSGPKSQYKGCDLTGWASGGYLYMCGDPDRPPVWISFPQAALHAGAEAASGTMAALWHQRRTGEGQVVDVSIQECVVACCFNAPEMWDLNKVEFTRLSKGINIGTKGVKIKAVWECKDGYAILIAQGGVQPFVGSMRSLTEWMVNEGMAEEWFKQMDWAGDYDASKLTQATVDKVEAEIANFFLTKTKAELYEEGALTRRILIGPLHTTKDLSEDRQLESRNFWMEVEHPELNDIITYPGPGFKLNNNPVQYNRRAPLIGEHNIEVYETELGISGEELTRLQESGAI